MKYICPVCNTKCSPVQYITGDWWIRHGAYNQCALDLIMLEMNEKSKYQYLFVDLHAQQLQTESAVWNEFINIYETKLKYILVLEQF